MDPLLILICIWIMFALIITPETAVGYLELIWGWDQRHFLSEKSELMTGYPMIPCYRIEEFRTHPVEIELQNLGMLKIFSALKTCIKKVTRKNLLLKLKWMSKNMHLELNSIMICIITIKMGGWLGIYRLLKRRSYTELTGHACH